MNSSVHSPKTNIPAWVISIIIVICIFSVIFHYKKSEFIVVEANASIPEYEPSITIEALRTKAQTFHQTSQVNGVIKPVKQLMLKNELAGEIKFISLISGQVVNEGETLLTLDSVYEQANLIASKAKIDLYEKTLARYKQLAERNEISADLVDQATADLAIAQSDAMYIEATLKKKTIKAPFRAVVGLHHLSVGQYLDKNTSIVELVGLSDTLWLEFSLPQSFPQLLLGDKVLVQSLFDHNQSSAEIIAINPTLASQSRHLKYRAKFLRSTLDIKPNTLVNVVVPTTAESKNIIIPDIAITHDQFGDYVYTLSVQKDASYRAKRMKVTKLQTLDNQIVLLEGLSAGELIATKGAFKLHDGSKVNILNLDTLNIAIK